MRNELRFETCNSQRLTFFSFFTFWLIPSQIKFQTSPFRIPCVSSKGVSCTNCTTGKHITHQTITVDLVDSFCYYTDTRAEEVNMPGLVPHRDVTHWQYTLHKTHRRLHGPSQSHIRDTHHHHSVVVQLGNGGGVITHSVNTGSQCSS